MKTDHNDQELRQLFRELRQDDRRNAPAFPDASSILARTRTASRMLFRMRMAAAAALLVAAISVAVYHPRTFGPSETDAVPWSALSNWQPSTDGLLSLSSVKWNGSVTVPSDSFSWSGIDEATSETPTSNRKETL